jgi:phage terminase Nu1 subunit (DNA packaging protein)
LSLVTLTEVADLTGKAWRTIKQVVSSAGIAPAKRTKKSDLYESGVVLRAVYAPPEVVDVEDLDPIQEKARKDKESADKLAMENAVRRGELAQRKDVVRFWSDCQAAARAKFMSIGSKLAPRLVNIGDANIIATAIRAEVSAGLAEFADYEPGGPERMVEGNSTGANSAAPADGERVGRPRKKAKQREQRRAGAMAD